MSSKRTPRRRPLAALRARLRRFRDDHSGVAAVEFALIAPVLVVLYIGLYQISFLIQQDRSVSHATSVMGDLTTRVGTLDEQGVEDIMQAAIQVLSVTNPDTLQNAVEMEISSFRMLADGTVERVGYARTQGSSFPPVDTDSLNGRMLSTQVGTVVARIRYQYNMLSNASADELDGNVNSTRYTGEGITLAEQFVMRPRVSVAVPFGDIDNPEDYTCTVASDLRVNCT